MVVGHMPLSAAESQLKVTKQTKKREAIVCSVTPCGTTLAAAGFCPPPSWFRGSGHITAAHSQGDEEAAEQFSWQCDTRRVTRYPFTPPPPLLTDTSEQLCTSIK